MRSSDALALAVAAAILVVAAVVLYSLVAQKMYAKDKEAAKQHGGPAAREETPDNPKYGAKNGTPPGGATSCLNEPKDVTY